MAAYAAMAHIRDAHPHRQSAVHAFAASSAPVTDPHERPVEEDLTGRSFDDRLADWWDGLTQNLSQTTFFLLDPESWR